MALVKFGGGITEMRGSIGGTTFSRNRYGAIARNRTKPVNPNTDRQVGVRAAMAFLTNRWSQTVTALQRTAWNLYGSSVAMTNKLGETVFLTGFNHYVRSNLLRTLTTSAVIDDGPVVFELPAHDPTYTITATEAAQTIDNAFDVTMDWATEDGGFMFLFQGSPQNPQRNFFAGPWRLSGRVVGADPGPIVSPSTRPAVFPVAELQHEWGYARISRADGRLSQPFRDDAFVAA